MASLQTFKNPEDMYNFYNFLDKIKHLSETTIEDYMVYYRLFDINNINQDYINTFCMFKNNNSVVRGMLRNYLEFKKLHKTFELPPKPAGKGYKPAKMPRFISSGEIDAMIKYAYGKSFKNGLKLSLIYEGALRRNELRNITFGDFNWEAWLENPAKFCELRIHGKGNKERIVLINPETMNRFFMYLIEHNFPQEAFKDTGFYLFIKKGASDKPTTNNATYKLVKKMAWEALNRDIRPHELRHARAKELEARGVNIKDIKNYLGHTNLSNTEIYLHTTTEESIKKIKENLIPDEKS